MSNDSAFIKSTARGMYRTGEIARIVGIRTLQPKGSPARIVYEVEYADGKMDAIPVAPSDNYQLLTAKEVVYTEVVAK